MESRFQGRIVIVTGNGVQKTAGDINVAGGQAQSSTLDVTDVDSCRDLVARVVDTFGGVVCG